MRAPAAVSAIRRRHSSISCAARYSKPTAVRAEASVRGHLRLRRRVSVSGAHSVGWSLPPASPRRSRRRSQAHDPRRGWSSGPLEHGDSAEHPPQIRLPPRQSSWRRTGSSSDSRQPHRSGLCDPGSAARTATICGVRSTTAIRRGSISGGYRSIARPSATPPSRSRLLRCHHGPIQSPGSLIPLLAGRPGNSAVQSRPPPMPRRAEHIFP
jgi:hypothetical protein